MIHRLHIPFRLDVVTWKRFPQCWSFVRGIYTGGFPSQRVNDEKFWCFRCDLDKRPVVYTLVWCHYNTLQWRHNDHDGVSNHQPHGCLLNRLFRRKSKKTSKLRATGLCVGNSPGPVNSPHKGPVTRKMFPFDDVIMSTPKMESVIMMQHLQAKCNSWYLISLIWWVILQIVSVLFLISNAIQTLLRGCGNCQRKQYASKYPHRDKYKGNSI